MTYYSLIHYILTIVSPPSYCHSLFLIFVLPQIYLSSICFLKRAGLQRLPCALWDTGLGLGSCEVWVCLISLGHLSTPSPGSLAHHLLLPSHRIPSCACWCPFLCSYPLLLNRQSLFSGKHFVSVFPLNPSHSQRPFCSHPSS